MLECKNVSISDVHNFMKVFDKNQDGQLKHSEFCDAFLPIDALLASKLAHTPPQEQLKEINFNDPHEVMKYRKELFSWETKKEFGNLWKTHFSICASLA